MLDFVRGAFANERPMSVLRRKFFEVSGDVYPDACVHGLALDDQTGHVFVISGFNDECYYETQTELADFLQGASEDVRSELFMLIGTLFDEGRKDGFILRRS